MVLLWRDFTQLCARLIMVGVVCAALASPAVSGAATLEASISDDFAGMSYLADPGEANRLVVRPGLRATTIEDVVPIRITGDCRHPDPAHPERVSCPARLTSALIEVVDGDDHVEAVGLEAMVRGGDGNDVLAGDGALAGGPGADRLTGGPRGAVLAGGAGADELIGGPGIDWATWAGRAEPVHADLDGARDDGSLGEGDLVSVDVDGLQGGSGDDHLVGNDRPNGLDGMAGTDLLEGAGGGDAIRGGDGSRNVVLGGSGDDSVDGSTLRGWSVIEGGLGDDSLYGGAGPDMVDGGAGVDQMAGNGGADTVRARDGNIERITCSNGLSGRYAGDRAVIDNGEYPAGCGSVDRPGTPVLVFLNAYVYTRTVNVGFGCPSDGRRCTGRWSIFAGRRLVRRGHVDLRAGHGGFRQHRLSRRARRVAPPDQGYRLSMRLATRDAAGRVVVKRRRLGSRPDLDGDRFTRYAPFPPATFRTEDAG